MQKILIDRGFLTSSGEPQAGASFFQDIVFQRAFGATLGSGFDSYKYLYFTFKDYESGVTKREPGFIDIDAFVSFMDTNFLESGTYKGVELILEILVDTKMTAPSLYAKNRVYSVLAAENVSGYRQHSSYVEGNEGAGFYNNGSIPNLLEVIWNDLFSSGMTATYLTNNPDMKKCFWMRRLGREGIPKDFTVLDREFLNMDRMLFNVTDSDVAGNVLAQSNTSVIQAIPDFIKIKTGGSNPYYYVIDNSDTLDIIFHGEIGIKVSYANYSDVGYSVIMAYPIEYTTGGKTYRSVYLINVGNDTLYCDGIDGTKTRVFALRRTENTNPRVKLLKDVDNDPQPNRKGMWAVNEWGIINKDATSSSPFNSLASNGVYLFYQDKASLHCSPLSMQKMTQILQNKVKIPIFKLRS